MAGPISGTAASKSKPSNPNKRKLLDDSDSDSDDAGAAIGGSGFKVNEEYARRFEHNKKREEKHRLEEKLKREGDDEDSSSSDEDEDEDGFLATEDLDVQISATLQAIRNKDPRVYDKETTFYAPDDENADGEDKEKKQKPVFLRDYQREKILRGDVGASDDEEDAPKTYQQEQDAIKKSLLSEIDAAKDEEDSDDDEDDDGFMKRKAPAQTDKNGLHPSRAKAVKLSEVDVDNADRDPETFLSNFMAARAWVADEGSRWEAFESDDGEEDNRADEFEEAYNLRFENPEKSNEVLKSYARDFAAARSVRREEKTGRKRQRELEREKKEAEKAQRREDKARLRNLKLEETESKLRKIKQAAGAFGKELTDEQWMKFLDDAWENDKWEDEMKKWFDEGYYAINEANVASDDDDEMDVDGEGSNDKKSKKKKPKKPTWDDDIDIKDLIPDFEDDEAKPNITLTDDEAQDDDDDDEEPSAKKLKSSDHKKARQENQKKARQERTKLEALVDAKMNLTDHDILKGNNSSSSVGGFRYRETSPQSFGMTARDILLAPSDKVLNEYAGLKKLATFRDAEKKRKDKKHLGKKARLRQWRRDVFGGEFEHTGPTYGFERVVATTEEDGGNDDVRDKKRSLKKKDRASKAKDGEEASNIIGDVDGTRKKRKRSKGKKAAKE
ncbi:protein KRI1 homolog [Trichoderma asperellum]|uniref:Protein KRI1 homolog n=1 Tax=Trichoderma asperellum TaxID=101201 RepID=A0A6V8R3E4_TRIAP|nr:protein KRI1 homolog [Trichoderma asperellum]